METTTIRLTVTAEQRAQRHRAVAAIREISLYRSLGPFPCSLWMGEGYIELRDSDNGIFLNGIWVDGVKRKAGIGQTYLQEIIDAADKHQVNIECHVKPFGHAEEIRPDSRALARWYKKNGFKIIRGRRNMLMRQPKPA
jgi:ribosomal protein S18 acetylase RimI-like enzyme